MHVSVQVFMDVHGNKFCMSHKVHKQSSEKKGRTCGQFT